MDEVILRAIERLLAVVIGGLCVYLGYRLFLRIPEQKADGKGMGLRLGQPRGVSSVGPIWRCRPSSTEAFRSCPILSRWTGGKPMKPLVAAIATMLLVQSTAGASSIAYMYPARTLERERPRFEQRIGELYRIISSLLSPQEQRALAGVKME